MSPLKNTPPPKTGATANGNVESDGPWRLSDDGTKVRNSKKLPLENKLNELLTGAGALIGLQDEFVGLAVTNKSPEIAYGWAKLASEEPRVKRALEFILEGSAWSEALIPTLTLGLVVAWHYGIFVPDRLGVPLSMAVGAFPVSREQEQEIRVRARAEAQQAAAAKAQVDTDKPINGDDGAGNN